MILQLDDKFKITTDSSLQNYQLEQLTDIIDKKTREVVRKDWIIQGFHGNSMRSVLIQYTKQALITEDNLETLHNVLDKLNEIDQTIDRVVKKENIRMDNKNDQ